MFTLYCRPNSGSVVVEALLELSGVKYRLIESARDASGGPPADLLRLNPLGQVPTMILPDDSVMTESGAMVLYLADKFPQMKLAPAISSPKRAAYLRWLMFLATNIYMTDLEVYYPERHSTDATHGPAIRAAALAQMARQWEIFAAVLGEGPFILGAEMTAVDVYAAMIADWNVDMPSFFAKHPNVQRMYQKVLQKPVFAKVWARNEAIGG
jgi:glutathione S-transferase